MFVLPEHRGKGLAEAMLRYSITAAHKDTLAFKLHVLIGNPAEQLYLKTGFVPGPSFTIMKYKVGTC
jgi:GNAT superfamily N-acetyltransferase